MNVHAMENMKYLLLIDPDASYHIESMLVFILMSQIIRLYYMLRANINFKKFYSNKINFTLDSFIMHYK